MSFYECVFITRQEISPAELEKITDKYIKLIESNKGKYKSKEDWGLRNLAYKIKNNRKGNYTLLNFEAEPETILELERVFRIDDDIIRYLTTKIKVIPKDPSIIMKQRIEKENYKTESTE